MSRQYLMFLVENRYIIWYEMDIWNGLFGDKKGFWGYSKE